MILLCRCIIMTGVVLLCRCIIQRLSLTLPLQLVKISLDPAKNGTKSAAAVTESFKPPQQTVEPKANGDSAHISTSEPVRSSHTSRPESKPSTAKSEASVTLRKVSSTRIANMVCTSSSNFYFTVS